MSPRSRYMSPMSIYCWLQQFINFQHHVEHIVKRLGGSAPAYRYYAHATTTRMEYRSAASVPIINHARNQLAMG